MLFHRWPAISSRCQANTGCVTSAHFHPIITHAVAKTCTRYRAYMYTPQAVVYDALPRRG